ncbi:MAG TPA: NfeD family protein [Methylomirabilota bacterium]|nr:NfeD family protein [Methylomirabilota bacterium]
MPIDGIIDLGLAPFVERVLKEAGEAKAGAVVLDINTFGGRVDAAVVIRDALLNSPLRTVAFVNKRAISAGALISLATRTIAMGDGATIGAATPVQMGQGGETQATSEKSVSYVRKEFRATAEARGRPPLVAEAMVDPDVEIPGLIAKGKLLTLTTTEALRHKVADFRADTLEEVVRQLGLAGAEIRRPAPNWAERVVRFLTHPLLGSLLMTIGIIGIIVELRTPGFGVPGAVGIASLAAFFWGHWLVRLAGWEELLLVVVGLALLALEVFVLPGFGVAGVLGIAAILAGLGLSLVGAGATQEVLVIAAARVVFSLLIALVASVALFRLLPRLPFGRRVILETGLPPGGGWEAGVVDLRPAPGARGTTVSPLRPAGIADIGGARIDVVSEGDYIDAAEPIEVLQVEGNRVVVRHVRKPKEGA